MLKHALVIFSVTVCRLTTCLSSNGRSRSRAFSLSLSLSSGDIQRISRETQAMLQRAPHVGCVFNTSTRDFSLVFELSYIFQCLHVRVFHFFYI